ncbi:unnamed protein product [Dicrocoelium dendriticum]|nr:unnamed protein product [Dicrocoelium dendriticum]
MELFSWLHIRLLPDIYLSILAVVLTFPLSLAFTLGWRPTKLDSGNPFAPTVSAVIPQVLGVNRVCKSVTMENLKHRPLIKSFRHKAMKSTKICSIID